MTHRNLIRACMVAVLTAAATPAVSRADCNADWDHNCSVSIDDLFIFINSWLAGNGDFDGNGSTTIDDLFIFINAWLAGCTFDTPSLSVSPATGSLGTPVTITVSSECLAYRFNSTTTASWSGRFVPTVGTQTEIFSISFTQSDIQVVSPTQATLVLGTGEANDLPSDLALIESSGLLQGTLTVTFAPGRAIDSTQAFTPETDALKWEGVNYPDGPYGLDAPQRGSVITELPMLLLSQWHPTPTTPDIMTLRSATWAHMLARIDAVENAAATNAAPSSIVADLVTYDANDNEIDRISSITLTKLAVDGDSSKIIYISDITKPIILVDVAVNPANYPDFLLIQGTNGGSAVVVPTNN